MHFVGLGLVLDGVWRVARLLGGVFSGGGVEGYPPLFFSDCVDGGVTLSQTAKKYFWGTLGVWGVCLGIYILYPHQDCTKNLCKSADLQDEIYMPNDSYTASKKWQNGFVKIDKTKIAVYWTKIAQLGQKVN
jgi:hypothetical protein